MQPLTDDELKAIMEHYRRGPITAKFIEQSRRDVSRLLGHIDHLNERIANLKWDLEHTQNLYHAGVAK